MTKAEVIRKAKATGCTGNALGAVVCAMIGHSNIVENCMGYINCSRCGELLGDTLAGCYTNAKGVVVGHDCPTCRENYAKMDWHDKLYAHKDPLNRESI